MKKHKVEVNINVCFQFLDINAKNEEAAIETATILAEAILKTDLLLPWRNSLNEDVFIQLATPESNIME